MILGKEAGDVLHHQAVSINKGLPAILVTDMLAKGVPRDLGHQHVFVTYVWRPRSRCQQQLVKVVAMFGVRQQVVLDVVTPMTREAAPATNGNQPFGGMCI